MIELNVWLSSYNVPVVVFGWMTPSYTHTGQQVPLQALQDFEEKFDLALYRAKQYAVTELQQDCPLSLALEQFSPTQFNNLFQSTIFSQRLTFFENYIGDGCEKLSARYWDVSEPFAGEHLIVLDAFSSVIKDLVKNCDVVFNTPVLEIDYNSDKIKLITANKKYSADKVITTLPLGVLKNLMVKFNPSLPDTKQQAINAIPTLPAPPV